MKLLPEATHSALKREALIIMNEYDAAFNAMVEKLKRLDLKDIPEAPQDEDPAEIIGRPGQRPVKTRKTTPKSL